MVWVRLVIFCLTFISSIHASELSQEEINYFNIMDLNNDGYVSTDEINQSINIIFHEKRRTVVLCWYPADNELLCFFTRVSHKVLKT